MKPPYAVWFIYQRNEGLGDDHGPERFSLLYICGDGVASFQALYHGNHCVPDVVAVIQPGTGFGFNWTNFESPSGIFCKSVLGNPAGTPGYLLYGGWGQNYRPCCWEKVKFGGKEVHYWTTSVGELSLWKRNGS